ncbi:galactose oxidase [Rhizophagus irregularis]|nr:galactose oxidase [Rhizophagus irregularis]
MSKNILVYFLLWISFQVLVDVNCQLTSFEPSGLFRHTATLIDNKLYILGGSLTSNNTLVKGFFYLDISVPFNTQELSWQDRSSTINKIPLHDGATSVKGGANNDTLFLYGGFTNDPKMALIYTFDPLHSVWNSQEIVGINNTIRRQSLTGVIDYNGKFYLWGGTTSNDIIVNEMLILNTINLSWRILYTYNAPTARYHFGATLLPNNKIIYIGGDDDITSEFNNETLSTTGDAALSLEEIYIYDIIDDNWESKPTTGKIPSNRAAFSTILGLDSQRIIIYGGIFNGPGYYRDSSLYVLDLTNFNWYIPKITGKIPKPRAFHKANVISRYMVITFVPKSPSPISPSFPTPPSSSQTSNNSSDNSKMVGAITGSLLSGLFLSVGIFFLHKWNKNKQNQKHITRTLLIPHSYSNC